MSNNKKNKGRKKRTGRRNGNLNYDRTTGQQVNLRSKSNNTNKRCCPNSFAEKCMNLRMDGELERWWIGRNLQVIRGSIVAQLPENFVKKYAKHMDHFVKYIEARLNR